MPCPTATDLALALSLSFGGTEIGVGLPVWVGPRDCAIAQYEPAPVYVYDHSTGPRWTGNGWVYLPIGAYYPAPPPPVPVPPPAAVPPPAPPPPYDLQREPRRW
jgi:hypothetical protein